MGRHPTGTYASRFALPLSSGSARRAAVLQEVFWEFGERMVLGGAVGMTVHRVTEQRVRFAIAAPRMIAVYREEKPHCLCDHTDRDARS